jgi:hypothetical protein
MNNKWDIHWKDYYKVLQVHPTSGQEVIRAAYELLAKKYHPDLNHDPLSTQMMQDINEAYEVLGTLETRRLYHPEWLRKRREIYNQDTPPITSAHSETVEQYESTSHTTRTKPRMLPRVKWVIGFVAVFIVISLIIVLNNIPFSSNEIAKDIPFPTPNIVKTTPVSTYAQLATGTYIAHIFSGGLGELTIDNGLDLDSVAVLCYKGSMVPQTGVYIRANTSYTIKGIKDGVYVLYFVIGLYWDNNSKEFLEKTAFQQFEDEFEFETTRDEYSTWSVTLNPVIGGEANTIQLNEENFPSLK